jgi:hypothetical protein
MLTCGQPPAFRPCGSKSSRYLHYLANEWEDCGWFARLMLKMWRPDVPGSATRAASEYGG